MAPAVCASSVRQRQIRLYQTVQRLGGVGGCLEILDHDAEAVDRRGIVFATQIIAPYFHFLTRQMVKRQIEFQHGRPRIFAVWIILDHTTQRLQRLKGQPLVAANFVDLVIIA